MKRDEAISWLQQHEVDLKKLGTRLTDIVEAIESTCHVLGDRSLEAFEKDWELHWLVERGVDIVPEASRQAGAQRSRWTGTSLPRCNRYFES